MLTLHLWILTFIFAAISAAAAAWLAYSEAESKSVYLLGSLKTMTPSSRALWAGIWGMFAGLLGQYFNFYYVQPSLVGSFFGYSGPLTLALVIGACIGFLYSGKKTRAITQAALALAIVYGVTALQTMWYSVGPDNSKRFASLPKITVAKVTDIIPPTDEQHIVLVTPLMAELKARTVLSSKSNYSTRFCVGRLTLQAINGHRVYAAPLVPTNANDTFWVPLFGGRAESPGYVIVDAEDKEAEPQLRDGFHITLFEYLPWAMNLERFAYQAGFDQGDLDNATFEVDNQYQPHWSITYVTPAFGNIVGAKISRVLVVDVAAATPEIHSYAQGDPAIKWVDRVVSASLVQEYAEDWGKYGQAYSQSSLGAWLEVYFGISKQDTMAPAEGDSGLLLCYTKDEHCIFVVPMTSCNSSDHGVIGVLAFETDQNKATFYPGLRGFNHGGSVAPTMFGVKENGYQKYDVENLELYNIYGHLTWVAVYTRSQALGATAGAIGFMNAYSQEVSDVVYSTDLQSALRAYSLKLAEGNGSVKATQSNETVPFEGKIWRIAPNGSSWRFQLVGDRHYYDATIQDFAGTPLLRDGDHVMGSYMDTHQAQAAVRNLQLVDPGKMLDDKIKSHSD